MIHVSKSLVHKFFNKYKIWHKNTFCYNTTIINKLNKIESYFPGNILTRSTIILIIGIISVIIWISGIAVRIPVVIIVRIIHWNEWNV